jgi:glutathione S-transferase
VAYALEKGKPALDHLKRRLSASPYLLGDAFSVVDAYLATMLNWTVATPIKLADWPALAAYAARLRERPSIARAIAIELPLYRAEMERLAKAS